MFPRALTQLIDLLSRLPGVGPRQATRMAFYILRESGSYSLDLKDAIQTLRTKVGWCRQCFRSMDKNGTSSLTCEICSKSDRKQEVVAVVEKEVDLVNIEKTGLFKGTYHVLGGTLSLLDGDAPERLHIRELYERAENIAHIPSSEVIIATSSTTEGDSTAIYLERTLIPLTQIHPHFKITRLGRGLSLGAEIEYADEVTLENALNNRTGISSLITE